MIRDFFTIVHVVVSGFWHTFEDWYEMNEERVNFWLRILFYIYIGLFTTAWIFSKYSPVWFPVTH
jgi:hypothetical protein